MKKIFTLAIAVTCFLFSSKAQINKGSVLIGGTLNVYTNNVKNTDSSITTSTNFIISPSVGFAINTNTILGFSLLYGNISNKGYSSFKIKDNSYGAGIFLRKYKLLSKNFYLFGEGNLMFNYETYNYSTQYAYQSEYDSKSYGINLNISPGVAYNLTGKLQLEAGLQKLLSIGYAHNNETSKNSGYPNLKENNFGLSSSLDPVSLNNIFIGLRFLITK